MVPVIRAYNIPAAIVPDLLQAAAMNTADAYKKVPGITPKIRAAAGMAVKYAYVDAFKLVYLVAIAFGVLSIIGTFPAYDPVQDACRLYANIWAAAIFTRSIPPERKTLMRAIHMENETGGPRAAEVVEV